ncbi:MAG TPA: RNA polymerase sigma factor [Steroidobacteraceae bacterium]|nr:RNA polymerase sigma factor [Steroidobacteraceae bacterium]
MSESQVIQHGLMEPASRSSSDGAARDLFARLAQGGQAAERAAGELYDEYGPRFRAFLRMRAVSAQQAEDLVHDVFVRVIEAGPRLAQVDSPRAYLWCTLRNALTDQMRQMRRDRRLFTDPPAAGKDDGEEDASFEAWLEKTAGSDAWVAERIDHLECVGRALERFRRQEPERAAAIDLVAIEGFEGRELAEALGKSYGAAREYLSQARKALKSLVQALCGSVYA